MASIGILGGTGKQGRGLALRWSRAGHAIVLGSREPARAAAVAAELGTAVRGGGYRDAAACAVVVISVPYAAQAEALAGVRDVVDGALVIDLVVPLQPPAVDRVSLPPGRAAALEARKILGSGARLVAALHHVSSAHLGDLDHVMTGDVLVCGDSRGDVDEAIALVGDLGMRGVDAGGLDNAVALEAMTPVLIHMNKRYRRRGLGLRIDGLEP